MRFCETVLSSGVNSASHNALLANALGREGNLRGEFSKKRMLASHRKYSGARPVIALHTCHLARDVCRYPDWGAGKKIRTGPKRMIIIIEKKIDLWGIAWVICHA